jgi:hypothetical protein
MEFGFPSDVRQEADKRIGRALVVKANESGEKAVDLRGRGHPGVLAAQRDRHLPEGAVTVMDTDTVDYPEGTFVWISRPGHRLTAGCVTGYGKSGKPLVRKAGADKSVPISKVYLSRHPQNNWGG